MNKADKVQLVLDTLQALYPEPSIPLNSHSPYTHLVAVLLSAQCTDVRVNTVTPELFQRADRPEKMVKLKVEQIKRIIRPCGLAPRKSQAISDLSHILLDEHGGEVPPDMEALERLPGVGHSIRPRRAVPVADLVVPTWVGVPTRQRHGTTRRWIRWIRRRPARPGASGRRRPGRSRRPGSRPAGRCRTAVRRRRSRWPRRCRSR